MNGFALRAAVVSLLFLAPHSAVAQIDRSDVDSAGLAIEASAGWDSMASRSTPVPISFLIDNSSERIIKGRFTLFDPLTGRFVNLGEVVVSPGAARRFATIQTMTDWYECFATFADGDRVLWRRELHLFDPKVPDSRGPFHPALEHQGPRGEKMVKRAVEAATRVGRHAVAELVSELRAGESECLRAGLVVGSLIDPARIGNPHVRAHASEGKLFREIVESGLSDRSVALSKSNRKESSPRFTTIPIGVRTVSMMLASAFCMRFNSSSRRRRASSNSS